MTMMRSNQRIPMPGSRGWEDYIPAHGEASVNLGLKGSYGKKPKGGSMRFRRGRFSRFRRSTNTRFWMCDAQALYPNGANSFSNSSPTLVAGISPNLSQPTPTSATLQTQQKYRLVGIQGDILVWRDPADESDLVAGVDSGLPGNEMMFLWYIWKRMQLTSDSLSAQATGNNDPAIGGDIQTLLQGDDVLNWGRRRIIPPRYRSLAYTYELATTTSPSVVQPYDFYGIEHFPTKIPPPRIPRRGITLSRNEAVVCYARALQWSRTGQEWVNPQNVSYWVHPMMRARYER